MPQPTSPDTIDIAAAHRFFAVDCFNRVWDLIEKTDRTPEDDEQMRLMTLVSLWHWTQRDDCTPRTLSIGFWQASRVFALLGEADNAARYGAICLRYSADEGPFYVGFAHEALARAAMVAGDAATAATHRDEARRCAARVEDAEERALLEKDLETL